MPSIKRAQKASGLGFSELTALLVSDQNHSEHHTQFWGNTTATDSKSSVSEAMSERMLSKALVGTQG